MAEVSLELLQSMVQSVLDEQKVARGERGRILQRLSRVQRMLLTVLRAQLNNADTQLRCSSRSIACSAGRSTGKPA